MRRPAAVRTAAALALALLVVACSDDDAPKVAESNGTEVTEVEATEPTRPTGTEPTDTAPEVDTLPDETDPTMPEDTTPVTDPEDESPFGWESFGDPSVEVGSLEVPIDYDDPSKGTFDLYVARRLASNPDERIGSLLVNPGGPGFGGSDFAIYADQIYSQDLLDHFDIIGWDPRGTGLSAPFIDCIDDYDRYFASTDITPDDDAERQQIIDLAAEFQELCVEENPDIFQYVGTNNSARDMDSIREALGEEQISYFGFSYGSELGATWATLFPDTVRAAVLDGAADPTADMNEGSLQQMVGFEASLATFLADCSADATCAFHSDGDAEGAFDTLMEALDESPVPSVTGRPDVTRGVALTAVIQAMYADYMWPQLAQALADAQAGDGAGLLDLYDQYFQRTFDGTYDNSLEAFQVISCMDSVDRPTVAEDDATAPDFQAVAPRLAPGTTGSYFCTFFPDPVDPRVDITGAGAGPILVVGTTGDPSTPLASSEVMADTLEEGVLLVVVANQHTGYGVNQCSYDVVDDYLIELTVPEDGVRCE